MVSITSLNYNLVEWFIDLIFWFIKLVCLDLLSILIIEKKFSFFFRYFFKLIMSLPLNKLTSSFQKIRE